MDTMPYRVTFVFTFSKLPYRVCLAIAPTLVVLRLLPRGVDDYKICAKCFWPDQVSHLAKQDFYSEHTEHCLQYICFGNKVFTYLLRHHHNVFGGTCQLHHCHRQKVLLTHTG
jgi:hypothetical protein